MAVEIQLTKGQVTIVDECDADLANYKWSAFFNKKYGGGGRYLAVRSQQGKSSVKGLMHRVIMARIISRELERKELIDHRNGDTLDNRRENLRIATNSQNNANRSKPKHSTQPYKGVRRRANHITWEANIRINGKPIFLGSFETAEEARDVYRKAATEAFGEFAKFD